MTEDEVDSDIESNEDAAPNLSYLRVPRRYFIKQESAEKSEKVQRKVLRAPLMIVLNFVTVAAAIWVIWQTERWITKHRMGLVNVNELWVSLPPLLSKVTNNRYSLSIILSRRTSRSIFR